MSCKLWRCVMVCHSLSACVSPVLRAVWSPVRLGSRGRADTGLPMLVCLPGGVGPGPCVSYVVSQSVFFSGMTAIAIPLFSTVFNSIAPATHELPPAARVWGAWPSQRNVCRINHSALLRAVWSRSAVRRSLACPIGYLARSVSRFCAARCWAASRRAVLQLPPSLSPAEGCA